MRKFNWQTMVFVGAILIFIFSPVVFAGTGIGQDQEQNSSNQNNLSVEIAGGKGTKIPLNLGETPNLPYSTPEPVAVGLKSGENWNDAPIGIMAAKDIWTMAELRMATGKGENVKLVSRKCSGPMNERGDNCSDSPSLVNGGGKAKNIEKKTWSFWSKGNSGPEDNVKIVTSPDGWTRFKVHLMKQGVRPEIIGEIAAVSKDATPEEIARYVALDARTEESAAGVWLLKAGAQSVQENSGDTYGIAFNGLGVSNNGGGGGAIFGWAGHKGKVRIDSEPFDRFYAFKYVALTDEEKAAFTASQQQSPASTAPTATPAVSAPAPQPKPVPAAPIENKAETSVYQQVETCDVYVEYDRNKFVPRPGQDVQIKGMAIWIATNLSAIKANKWRAGVESTADETPTGLAVGVDRINPWIALQRSLMLKTLITPYLREMGISDADIETIEIVSMSNLSQVVKRAVSPEDHQKNRRSYVVFLGPRAE